MEARGIDIRKTLKPKLTSSHGSQKDSKSKVLFLLRLLATSAEWRTNDRCSFVLKPLIMNRSAHCLLSVCGICPQVFLSYIGGPWLDLSWLATFLFVYCNFGVLFVWLLWITVMCFVGTFTLKFFFILSFLDYKYKMQASFMLRV